jgi:alpha-amylase
VLVGWALPPAAALRLARLRHDVGEARPAGPDGALVRGAHWRNFQVKYSESNRMHKKMQALSALCRRKGNPPDVRRAIGRAQCNDAYCHVVFGGLYLPHLRDAVWRELAYAEG